MWSKWEGGWLGGQKEEPLIEVGACAHVGSVCCWCGVSMARRRAQAVHHPLYTSLTRSSPFRLPPALQARDDGGCRRLCSGDEFQVALYGPSEGEKAAHLLAGAVPGNAAVLGISPCALTHGKISHALLP